VRLAREAFVPVVGDDWYRRRQEDAEGRFLRRLADQRRPRPSRNATRQGIYVATASGTLLTFKNHQDPDVMRAVLRRALQQWKKLPAAERRPGGVKVPALGRRDPTYLREPPEGGVILRVHERILDREGGTLVPGTCAFPGGDRSARDHVWLKKEEWQSLLPADAKKGDRVPMPAKIRDRLLRFHLVDFTRGEPDRWSRAQVRKAEMAWVVEESTPARLRMRLEGSALLATHADPARAKRGFDVALLGYLEYDRARKALTRFDLLAVGDHWGDGRYTGRSRPGRQPLGLTFDLVPGDRPGDRVPPQAARNLGEYFGR
jgi:hypothetical protein